MSTRDLTQGAVPVSLFRLTAPMMAGVSANILVGMLEIGFIGQLSTHHVAAITFTFPVTMILSSIALGIGIGTSSVIARSVGARATEEVRRLGAHAIVLVIAAMSVLSLVGYLTIDPVFTVLGASTDVLTLIHSYLDIYYPTMVLFTVTMVAGNIMRANGNAAVPGLVMTLGALANLGMDPLLIFGWFGLPRLELAGAAVAAAISRLGTASVLLYYVGRGDLIITRDIFSGLAGSARQILHIGLPAMATQLIGPVSGALITRLLAGHGAVVVAGFGVATRIEAVAVMILFALSASIGPFVGQNWGGGHPERVREGLRVTYQFCLAWGVLVAIPLAVIGGHVASLVNDSPEVIATAAWYLSVVPWSYGFWGVLMMSSASFNALGKPLPSTALSFSRMFILYIPLALLLDHFFGYHGIFIATAVSNGLMGVLGFLWFRRRFFPRGG
ncbi:MAG: MATE family efflux transporter [Pseudomonadales bacterium]|jgi:putative MATE family efflux protein